MRLHENKLSTLQPLEYRGGGEAKLDNTKGIYKEVVTMHPDGSTSQRASWPYVEDKSYLRTWLFVVPLVAYTLWQILYFLNVLQLSKKAQKANNTWWRLSGVLGDQNRMLMYILLQAAFTVATMALDVPVFSSYELHVIFQILKVSASIWNGGSFLLEVMPMQVIMKEKKKLKMLAITSPT
ncbi:hypothetical protein MKW92_035315 [Papaver armeniacum]|nr:hypothetical protein MKW92_035315 [Papaver armeniacum]